ncbi:MAG: hypothetical protein ACM65K_26350 [Microcoleus sp.]
MKSASNPSEVLECPSKAEIIDRIQKLVPPGSLEPQAPETIAALQTLTAQLIRAYKADGQLESEPFEDVRDIAKYTCTPPQSATKSKAKPSSSLVAKDASAVS